MLNKRRKNTHSLNPYKIDNYNKFLITLDKQSLNSNLLKSQTPFTTELDNLDNPDEADDANKSDNPSKTVSKTVNKIIKKSNDIFENNLVKPSFTGKNKFDLLFKAIELTDPNLYDEIINSNKKEIKRIPTPKNEIIVKPKRKVNINCEINSISDILSLINTYNLDPEVEYNININALHRIKEPLENLNNMIGMKNLKNNIIDQILYFIQNLHKNKNDTGDFMHTVIYGPPGTGKTEVSKIIGKIFSKMGILDKDRFIKVTRADLIAGYLGQTAIKTKDVIKDALGGVLFIDEAYALGNVEKRDSFSKECIDTLCEALSDYKDNLMVIIAGYEEELKDCFFNYNQGLESRFTWRFKTDEYTAEDLYNIFIKKIKDIEWSLSDDSKITVDWFKTKMDYFKYFGRDIETIISKTKIAHSRRVFCNSEEDKKKITLADLDNGFKLYLKNNNEVQKRKDTESIKKQIINSMYC